ncbi:MAG: hypothetical protein H8E32_02475 [Nitrospinae bacterium]|nr:hypothetical protein [Nitrospinota bacterium]
MKIRHNKKRNTAFIFEALIRELTRAIVAKDNKKKSLIIKLVRENFKGSSALAKDLELYKAVLDTNDIDRQTAEKLIYEARLGKKIINEKQLFQEQTEVIDKINKLVSPSVFSNFIPNYRDVATVYQIFDFRTKTKQRVLMEKQMIDKMTSPKESYTIPAIKPIDKLTYKTFVSKFNEKYSGELLSEQKKLLAHYIGSFTDNALELKIYLNEEISRLREKLQAAAKLAEVREDPEMLEGTKRVVEILNGFSEKPVDNDLVQEVLKIQNLVKEIEN